MILQRMTSSDAVESRLVSFPGEMVGSTLPPGSVRPVGDTRAAHAPPRANTSFVTSARDQRVIDYAHARINQHTLELALDDIHWLQMWSKPSATVGKAPFESHNIYFKRASIVFLWFHSTLGTCFVVLLERCAGEARK